MTAGAFKAWAQEFFARFFVMPPMVGIADWARENIELGEDESLQFPGRYDPELSPTATAIWYFMESPEWREFIGVKSSQIGFTLAMLVAVCHKIAFNPQHIIFCLNSREEIKRIGAQRLKPMIQGCKVIAARVPEDEDKLQNLTLYLNGMAIYLVGAQSAGSLANKSVGLVIGDEVDEWPEELRGGESNALDLLRDRIKRVADAKLVVFSKPKNEGDIIWPEYLTGSRHKWFVPCPHCSEKAGTLAGFQELVWEQVRYEHCRDPKSQRWNYERLIQETFYECVHCRAPIDENAKSWMMKLGHRDLRPTNDGSDDHPPIPRKFSFHTSDLYNLPHVPDSRWGDLAKEFVSCTTASQRRRFRRSRLGLPESDQAHDGRRTVADILALQGSHERGHVPVKPTMIVMGVDVQHSHKPWAKVAFLRNGAAYVVDHGSALTFAELLIAARTPVIVDDWENHPIEDRINPVVDVGLIDEGDGHYTKTVLDFCTSREAYRLFWPAKGRGGQQTLSMRDLVDFQKKNVHNGKRLPRYIFNGDAFKEEVYDERIGLNREIRRALRDGLTPPAPPLYVYRAPEIEFCEHLTTERRWTEEDDELRRRRKKKGSGPRKIIRIGDWFREGGPNDWGDAVVMTFPPWYRLKRYLSEEDADDEESA